MSFLRAAAVAGPAALLLFSAPLAGAPPRQGHPAQAEDLAAFRPRIVGPAVTGGRAHDVVALPDDPSTFFVATASSGLWKTTNRGHTWRNVFDTMAVSTFGAVAMAPSDPRILYAGTGEQNNRQSTSWGNGVYRSDDGGETWRHLGLEGTRHIGKIEVHPTSPAIVYVAALGNLWAASPDRGVYRSRDGGRTWERVLHVDEYTGAVDLEMDPDNPAVLYAATYQRLRRAWGFNGGGPGSGIHKSTDGGETWQELTRGIPAGDKGRIGIALARSNPSVLNALIQHAEESGVYRSEDAGETWVKVHDRNIRPMYYSHIYIDPTNESRVYTLATSSFRSEDGGRTWEEIAQRPTYDVGVHADHHAMWIDPRDPDHFYLVGDAGLHETYDRGENFRKLNNFPIGQFYAIGVDMRDPYWIYGGMQDNHSWMGPSRTRHWIGILADDWKQIGFGDGMYQQPDPTSHRYVYVNAQNGSYTRVDAETGDIMDIRPRPPEGEEYRWDWVSPSLLSRHDPSVVYVGGNRLFVSRDRGSIWEPTEDLTRAIDRDTLRLMGVAGRDVTLSRNDGTASFGEIVSIAESPLDPRILWVGTDDGNVQVSRDGGRTWTEVARNVRGVRDGTYVSRVMASASGTAAAYVAFDAHRDGDFAPYVFRTRDFGATWEPLAAGLPSGSVNSLVEHPDNPQVLFLGTEHHLFVSTDAGAHWARMPNLPTTHYDDLVLHPRDKDLVMGTHGRSIWILDDTTPLAEWTPAVASAAAHVFSIRPATIFNYWKDTSYRGQAEWHGENPPDGALVTYRLGPGSGSAVLRVQDESGTVVREMAVPSGAGVHRANWDLRHGLPGEDEEWQRHDHPQLPRPVERRGPFVSPGSYSVALEARGTTVRQTVEVRGDPLMSVTFAQYRERERFLLEVLALEEQASRLLEAVAPAEPREGGDEASSPEEERLRRARQDARRLYTEIDGSGVRQGTLYPPTPTQRDRLERLQAELAEAEEAPGGR